MAVEIRRVVYSPSRGVFLRAEADKQTWSKDPGVLNIDLARTFRDAEDWATFARENMFAPPTDAVLAEVHPIGWDKTRATVEDVANAALPRWGD